MTPCIMATVDTAGAGDASAIAAGRGKVTVGGKPGAEPVCGALATDALDGDTLTCDLTSGGVATDNGGTGTEPWRKRNKTN